MAKRQDSLHKDEGNVEDKETPSSEAESMSSDNEEYRPECASSSEGEYILFYVLFFIYCLFNYLL